MSLQNVQHVITKCGKITTVRPHLCAENRFRNLTVFSGSHRAKAPIKFCLSSLGTTLAKEKNLFFLLSRNVGTSVLLFDPYLSSPRRGKRNRYFCFFGLNTQTCVKTEMEETEAKGKKKYVPLSFKRRKYMFR